MSRGRFLPTLYKTGNSLIISNLRGGGKTFWQRHKGKILGAAALAGAAGLGALGYANKDKIANISTPNPSSGSAPNPSSGSAPNPSSGVDSVRELHAAKSALTSAHQSIEHLNWVKDLDDWVMDLESLYYELKFAAKNEYTHADALVLRRTALTKIDPQLSEVERRRTAVSDPKELKKLDKRLSMAYGSRNKIASIR